MFEKKLIYLLNVFKLNNNKLWRRFTAFNIGGEFLELSQTSTMEFFCENN